MIDPLFHCSVDPRAEDSRQITILSVSHECPCCWHRALKLLQHCGGRFVHSLFLLFHHLACLPFLLRLRLECLLFLLVSLLGLLVFLALLVRLALLRLLALLVLLALLLAFLVAAA